MGRVQKIICFVSLLTALALLSLMGCGGEGTEVGNPNTPTAPTSDSSSNPPPSDPNIEICKLGGGTWIPFSDTCGDSCDVQRNTNIGCAQAITYGCECGPDKCWNGSVCESL